MRANRFSGSKMKPYGKEAQTLLDHTFDEQIGHRGIIDLTSCDFVTCGIVKELMFSSQPEHLDELKWSFKNAFDVFNAAKELLFAICELVISHCRC